MDLDLSTIGEAITSLKAATDIVKTLRGLKSSGHSDSKISELYGVILSAQDSAIAAKESQFVLLQSISRLEKKIAEFETWDREKTRYELKDVNPGRGSVYAYALKPEAAGGEPIHLLCAKCFQHRIKSPLQSSPKTERGQRLHFCPECKTEYAYGVVAQDRGSPMRAQTDYDPFSGS